WGLMLKRVKCCPFPEDTLRLCQDVPTHRFEERVPGGHPFQSLIVGRLAIRRAARVPGRQRGELPSRFSFIAPKELRGACRFERVRQAWNDFEGQRYELC